MFARFSLGLVLALLICQMPHAAEINKDREGIALPEGAVARLGTLSFRLLTNDQSHGSMAMSHDGKRIAVFETGKVHVWEVETGKTLQSFDYPYTPGYVEPVAISADGKRVIAFNASSGVQAWDVDTGKTLFSHEEVGRSQASMGIGFLADGTAVYSRNFRGEDGEGNFVALHDAETRKELKQFKGELGHSFALDINPDGKTLTGGMFDRENACVHVRLYDAKTFELKKSVDHIAKGEGCNVASSCPDGSVLLIVTQAGDITFWNPADGTMMSKLEENPVDTDHPVPAALSWDGKIAAVSGGWDDNTLRLYDTATGKLIKKLEGSGRGGYIVISKDGKRIAHRDANCVQIWDMTTGKQMHRDLAVHRAPPTAVAYSPDGRQLASAGDAQIVLWDVPTGKMLARWDASAGKKQAAIQKLSFSADGKHLVAAGWHLATLWNVEKRKLLHHWESEEIYHGGFHPDATKLYVASTDGRLELWDIAQGKVLESNHEVLDDTLDFLVLSNNRLALSSNEGIVFYDGKTLRRVGEIPRPEGSQYLGLTADSTGRWLGAVRTQDMVWNLIEVTNGQAKVGQSLHNTARDMQSHASSRNAFAAYFGPERGLEAGTLILLDRATGQVRQRMNLPFGQVRGMCFSPDGRYLATGNSDTTVLIWDTWNLPDVTQNVDQLTPADLRESWRILGDLESEIAEGVVRTLSRRPDLAVPFLGEQLQQPSKVDAETLRTLLDQLESNRFAVREKASKELHRLGRSCVPELRKRFASTTSEDLKSRIEGILNVVDPPFLKHEALQASRGIEILMRIGTPASKELLQKLAKGDPESLLTREAKAALRE